MLMWLKILLVACQMKAQQALLILTGVITIIIKQNEVSFKENLKSQNAVSLQLMDA
jgi:hypothetical protein